MEAEFITNFDAMYIIIFQIIISTFVMRWKALNTMITGFIIASTGMALSLMTQNVIFIVVAIFVFAVGEMTASPKITEYIGRIAPPDKKALYMGYSFIPVFLGNIFAGIISGNVYQMMSDKNTFLKMEAAGQHISLPADLSLNQQFEYVAGKMNMTSAEMTNYLWDKYHPSSIWIVLFAIGLFAASCLWLYNRYAMRKNNA